MAAKKRHHLVPRFYLARFARGKRLAMRSRETMDRRTVSPRDAAVRTHFYSIDLVDGSRSSHVEDLLGEVESSAAATMNLLDDGKFPDTKGRVQFCLFLALQLTRGKDSRDMQQDAATRITRLIAKTVGRQQAESTGPIGGASTKPDDSDTTDLNALADSITVTIPNNMHIETMLHIANELGPHLLRRPWLLVRFRRRALLTGDLPIALYQRPEKRHPYFGVGVVNADLVAIPLDPYKILILGDPELPHPDMIDDGQGLEVARDLNRHIAFQSYEWIFHHPSHDPLNGVTLPPRPPMVT